MTAALALVEISQKPILGWGTDHFGEAGTMLIPETAEVGAAHNTFLQYWYGLGLLGGIGFLLLFLMPLRQMLRSLKDRPSTDSADAVRLGLACYVLLFIVLNVQPILYNRFVYIPLFVIAGFAVHALDPVKAGEAARGPLWASTGAKYSGHVLIFANKSGEERSHAENDDAGESLTVTVSAAVPAQVRRSTVACHVCSGTDDATYLEARGYRIARCKNCGLWFVNPQPTMEELRKFYATYDEGKLWRNLEERFNRGVRQSIQQVKRTGTVLDVGCGSGDFLRGMKEAGFSVFGIEPSGTGSEYGRETHGVDIYNGLIEEYLTANGSQRFDVITLLNVLEHLADPVRILSQLSQVLVAGGVVAIVVPDARFHDLVGRLRRFVGVSDPYWIEEGNRFLAGFRVPEHLCSFQPRTIASLLRRCGFRVVTMEAAPVIINEGIPRNAAKLLIFCLSRVLHYFTFRRVLIGYSTLVLAEKAASAPSTTLRA